MLGSSLGLAVVGTFPVVVRKLVQYPVVEHKVLPAVLHLVLHIALADCILPAMCRFDSCLSANRCSVRRCAANRCSATPASR